MPGMYCRVELDLGSKSDVLLVPLRALYEEPSSTESPTGRKRVRTWVVSNGKAKSVEVVVGLEHGEYGEVIAGLEEGAEVVIQGQTTLMDGAAVAVVGRRAPEAGDPTSRAADPASVDPAP